MIKVEKPRGASKGGLITADMTSVRIAKDKRVKLRSTGFLGLGRGEWFSSAAEGWAFVESVGYADSGQNSPPLRMSDLVDLQVEVLRAQTCEWLWLVELQNASHAAHMRQRFPDSMVVDCGIVCRIAPERAELEAFWGIHRRLDDATPWDCETSWAVAGVTPGSPLPAGARAEHLFARHPQLRAVFIQHGWFGCFGARKTSALDALIHRAFPGIFD